MELTWWQVYLWLKLDAIRGLIFMLISCSAMILLGRFFLYLDSLQEDLTDKVKYYKKGIIKSFSIIILLSIVSTTIPSTKEFATIYILPKLVNSKTFQSFIKEGDETGALLFKYMKQELKKKLKVMEDNEDK